MRLIFEDLNNEKTVFLMVAALVSTAMFAQGNRHYITNQKPLVEQAYTALPIGSIQPKGMLFRMLEIQADGLTGHLDSIYEVVCLRIAQFPVIEHQIK